MSPILALLNDMRGRLGMYIGLPSLTRLAAFLRGYDYALYKLGVGEEDPFLVKFRDWVHRHYQTTSESWEETILQQSADEADAVKHFWELLDKFLEETDAKHTTDGKSAAMGPHRVATE